MRFCGPDTMLLQLLALSIAMLLFPACVSGAVDLTVTENLPSPSILSTLSTQIISPIGTAIIDTHDSPSVLPGDSFDQPEDNTSKRGFDTSLLLTYDLRCDTSDAANLPKATRMPGKYNPASMLGACKNYWQCTSAGEMIQRGQKPGLGNGKNPWQRGQYDTCKQKCRCVVIDLPEDHYNANFGCVNPQGGWVAGGVGAISRGEGEPFDIGDGLQMQAYHGPRKE